MRILLVNSLYSPIQVGGAERSVQLLAEGLSARGHEVTVATLGRGVRLRRDDVNGVGVYRLPLRNVYWPYGGQRPTGLKPLWHLLDTWNPLMTASLRRVMDESIPQIVSTHNLGGFTPSIWREARLSGVAVVHTLRDYHLLCPNSHMYKQGGNCDVPCTTCSVVSVPKRRATRYVDAVVGVTRFILRRHLTAGYFEQVRETTVIGNSVALSTRVERATEPGRVRFGFIGRLTPYKGLEVLGHALRDLPRRRWRCLVAGDGEKRYERSLRAALGPVGIEFLGLWDPAAFYAKIDVLVVPSLWHEPFGRVVIEAFSQGVPVVASDRGGLTELVERGVTGWLFDPDQPAQLVGILQRIVCDPTLPSKMRAACMRRATSFTSESVAGRYEDFFQRVAEGAEGRDPGARAGKSQRG